MPGMKTIATRLNREFAIRLVGIAAVLIALAAWSIYDGHVAWPRENAALEAVRPSLLNSNLPPEIWLATTTNGVSPLAIVFNAKNLKVPARLEKALAECILPDSVTTEREAKRAQLLEQMKRVFSEPLHSAMELKTQDAQAAICGLLALIALIALFRISHNVICADENGLSGRGVGKVPLPYTAIRAIDRSRWESKGIVTLQFEDGREIKLDSWHRANVKEIFAQIESARPDLAAC